MIKLALTSIFFLSSIYSAHANSDFSLHDIVNGYLRCGIEKISIDRFEKRKLRSFNSFKYPPTVGDEVVISYRFNKKDEKFSFTAERPIGQELSVTYGFPFFSFDLKNEAKILVEEGKFRGPFSYKDDHDPIIVMIGDYERIQNSPVGNLTYDSVFFSDGKNQTAHFQRISHKGWVGVSTSISDPLLHTEPLTSVTAHFDCFNDDSKQYYFESWNTLIDELNAYVENRNSR